MANVEISRTFCWPQTLTSAPHLCLSPTQLLLKLGRLQPSASQLHSPLSPLGSNWLAPRLPSRWWILPRESNLTGGGEATGVATTEPEEEGQMQSTASAVCACVHVRACARMDPCAKCWYLWEVVLVHASPFSGVFPAPIMISIWTRSLSLVVGCKILFWKLTKYQHPLTPVCQGCCLTFPKKPKKKKKKTKCCQMTRCSWANWTTKKCKWPTVKEKKQMNYYFPKNSQ